MLVVTVFPDARATSGGKSSEFEVRPKFQS